MSKLNTSRLTLKIISEKLKIFDLNQFQAICFEPAHSAYPTGRFHENNGKESLTSTRPCDHMNW